MKNNIVKALVGVAIVALIVSVSLPAMARGGFGNHGMMMGNGSGMIAPHADGMGPGYQHQGQNNMHGYSMDHSMGMGDWQHNGYMGQERNRNFDEQDRGFDNR